MTKEEKPIKSPISGKPMRLKLRHVRLSYKEESWYIPSWRWLCEDSKEEFQTLEQIDSDLRAVYRNYRVAHSDAITPDMEQYKRNG